uniref:Uncharacterized protein n=1 Tax=Rhizophora mucronata TaxID=61149 RepID=A0A2P2NV49_RHIMU
MESQRERERVKITNNFFPSEK